MPATGSCSGGCSKAPLLGDFADNNCSMGEVATTTRQQQCSNGKGNGKNHPCGEHFDDDTYLCCPIPPDSRLAGIFLADRLHRLEDLSRKNIHLAMLCLVYIGVNVACLIVNSMSSTFREKHELQFHLLEFWATFGFSLVGIYALMLSPRSFSSIVDNPMILKILVFIDVVATFTSAALVTISLKHFEVISHELEYANELTMAFFDLVLLSVLARRDNAGQQSSAGMCILAILIAVVQLAIYNMLDGPRGGAGEQIAHYFEFCFEILSATVTFMFCMDNKFNCDRHQSNLLQLQHLRTEEP